MSRPNRIPTERRDDARTPMSLSVRLMAGADTREGRLVDFSLGGMAIMCKPRLPLGVEVVTYVDKIARIEGTVRRYIQGGFVVAFDLSELKARRVQAALRKLSDEQAAPDLVPAAPATPIGATRRKKVEYDGECIECEVKDATILGVTCESAVRPPIGEHVVIGGAEAKVVRHLPTGFAVEFDSYWDSVSPWTGRR